MFFRNNFMKKKFKILFTKAQRVFQRGTVEILRSILNGRLSSKVGLINKELDQTVVKLKNKKGGYKILKKPLIYYSYSGIFLCLLLLLTFSFIAAGCKEPMALHSSQSDNSALYSYSDSDSQISQMRTSGCKSAQWDNSNISITYVDSFLHVNHSNALLNCNYDTVNVVMSIENNIITLQEKETPNNANCLCPVDINYTVGLVSPGAYQVFILFHADTIYNQWHRW
jgi:hypothetical protein